MTAISPIIIRISRVAFTPIPAVLQHAPDRSGENTIDGVQKSRAPWSAAESHFPSTSHPCPAREEIRPIARRARRRAGLREERHRTATDSRLETMPVALHRLQPRRRDHLIRPAVRQERRALFGTPRFHFGRFAPFARERGGGRGAGAQGEQGERQGQAGEAGGDGARDVGVTVSPWVWWLVAGRPAFRRRKKPRA